jgi:SAM-dependent methyltransferase
MSDDSGLPLLLQHLIGGYAMLLLGLGRRTGLLDAAVAGPGTADEIAARAGVDPRNAREWLAGMTAAGYLAHDAGTFNPREAITLAWGPQFPADVRALLDGYLNVPQVYDALVTAIGNGGGLSADQLSPYAPFVGVNTPTYEQALVAEWIGGLPGVSDRLTAGGRVAELAPGNGAAAGIVGRAFPAATVVGYDLVPRPLPDLPDNVSILAEDARRLPDAEPFDLVYCLDSLHHMSDPGSVLAAAKAALAPGGVVLVAENDFSGDLDADAANPFATIAYVSSLVYCMQEALHDGGEVHTCAEGSGWVVAALEDAGFADVEVRHSETGYALVSGVA